jgi:hypothetical protein
MEVKAAKGLVIRNAMVSAAQVELPPAATSQITKVVMGEMHRLVMLTMEVMGRAARLVVVVEAVEMTEGEPGETETHPNSQVVAGQVVLIMTPQVAGVEDIFQGETVVGIQSRQLTEVDLLGGWPVLKARIGIATVVVGAHTVAVVVGVPTKEQGEQKVVVEQLL